MSTSSVKIGISAVHDGGNIEFISQSELEVNGRTAKCVVTVHVKPGECFQQIASYFAFLYAIPSLLYFILAQTQTMY